MRGARSTKTTIDGILFDSMQEAAMYCWCREALQLGIINTFKCHVTYDTFDKVNYPFFKQLKTKVKRESRTLLQANTYTCDFVLYPAKDLFGLMPENPCIEWNNHNAYVIDVKSAVNKAAAEFSLKQKMMWSYNKVYVNKVVVAYDTRPKKKPIRFSTMTKGFFYQHGRPRKLPKEFYMIREPNTLRQPWRRMLEHLPTIQEVHGVQA